MWLMLSILAANMVVSEAVHLHPDSPPQMPDLQAELQLAPLLSLSTGNHSLSVLHSLCSVTRSASKPAQ